MRGFWGIGIYHPKTEANIGTLWRSAFLYGADFIFTIGRRYKSQSSDTIKTPRHIPLWNFDCFEDFRKSCPHGARIVCIELTEGARPLSKFQHPQQAIYLLGAEDHGIPADILFGREKVFIETAEPISLNVAVAGSIVMNDRFNKMRT